MTDKSPTQSTKPKPSAKPAAKAVEAQTMSPVKLAPKPHPVCSTSELQTLTSQVLTFFHHAEHGVTLDDVLRPGYWKNVWRQLARFKNTQITVIAVDGMWEADLRVTSTGDGFAKTRLLRVWDAEETTSAYSLPADWETDFVTNGWRVRNADGAIVTSGHALEDEARHAALELIKKMSA